MRDNFELRINSDQERRFGTSPEGDSVEYWKTLYWLEAITPSGPIYAHEHLWESLEEAEWFQSNVEHYRHRDGSLRLSDRCWGFVRNIYGSRAWSQADEDELHRADVIGEFGEYRPGVPGYRG